MEKTNYLLNGRIISRFLLTFFILFSVSGVLQTLSGNDGIKFNPEYKLKRISGTTVSVYTVDQKGEKQEYLITDFNADVLLLVYRHIDIEQITNNLTRKYHLKETDCRRQVKMTLNTLEEWDIILRS
jgi:hypothetical protein